MLATVAPTLFDILSFDFLRMQSVLIFKLGTPSFALSAVSKHLAGLLGAWYMQHNASLKQFLKQQKESQTVCQSI